MTNHPSPTPLQAATKRCWKCESTKPVAEFSKDKSRQDGFQPICKPCAKLARAAWLEKNPDGQRKAWAKWYADPRNAKKHSARTVRHACQRADRLLEQFKSVPCADCHQSFATCVMEFDHLPGVEKSFGLNHHTMRGKPLDAIMDEIAKCQVVCANCHRLRTFTRNQSGRKVER